MPNLRKDNYLPVEQLCPEVVQLDKTQLPVLKDVLGLVIYKSRVSKKSLVKVVGLVATELEKHWYDQNVYPKARRTIDKILTQHAQMFTKLKGYDKSRLETETFKKLYNAFKEPLDNLFDIFDEDKERRDKMKTDLKIAPMTDEDFRYLQSQRSDRKMRCERNVDVAWSQKMASDQKRTIKYQSNQMMLNTSVSSEIISDNECDEIHEYQDVDYSPDVETPKGKKRPLYSPSYRNDNDPLPQQYRHIRQSGRGIVKANVCQAMAELYGHGFSPRDIQIALCVIGNKLFSRNWKLPQEGPKSEEEDNVSIYDQDDIPTRKAIRNCLTKIEVHRVKLVSEKIIAANESGATITHATDSTTRKRVGSFAVAGVHINKTECLPLPSMKISSETTQNVADTISQGFKLCQAASDISGRYSKQVIKKL